MRSLNIATKYVILSTDPYEISQWYDYEASAFCKIFSSLFFSRQKCRFIRCRKTKYYLRYKQTLSGNGNRCSRDINSSIDWTTAYNISEPVISRTLGSNLYRTFDNLLTIFHWPADWHQPAQKVKLGINGIHI
jgi:hypothetical protein